MAKASRASSNPVPAARGSFAGPDRRLASLYIKRSTNAPLNAQHVGMLSTYAPTWCGLASFASSLRAGLIQDRPGMTVSIARVTTEAGRSAAQEVVFELSTSDDELRGKEAAAELNKADVAVVHHDSGVFGGQAGEQVLQVMNWIRVPTVAVIHAVPASPSPEERSVLIALSDSADAVVTMSEIARQRLVALYGVAPRKTMVIPHGGRAGAQDSRLQPWPQRRPVIVTWGLLGPGKGIETALEAMLLLRPLRPLPRFIVAGPTHPRELALHSEKYRDSLALKLDELSLSDMVEFRPEYLSGDEIQDLVTEADVILLPNDSQELANSGVLAEAIAARVPIVATKFAQAEELLGGEHGGLLVPHDDPAQMAAALTRILTEPELPAQLIEKASGLAAALTWPQVAAQYRQLFDALLRRPTSPAR